MKNENNAAFRFKRPRLNDLFREASKYPLAMICAGTGFGKSSSVHDFLEDYKEASPIWIQISKNDNSGTRFWENFVHSMAQINQPLARALNKLGFPDTADKKNQYVSLVHTKASHVPRIIVLDDLHLIEDSSVLRLIEFAINSKPTKISVFIISRSTPHLNTASLISKDRQYNVNEKDLCFTESELAQFFSLLNITLRQETLREIMQDTGGWAFAINLIAHSYQKSPGYEGYVQNAMKANIFQLMEVEIWSGISERLRYFLLTLSLIENLSVDLISLLANGDESLIADLEKQSAYVRRDNYINAYLIHPLFLEFIRRKQNLLTEDQKRETWMKSAAWCDENGYHMDAFSYYDKSGDYEAITKKVASLNVQMSADMAEFALKLFDKAPEAVKYQTPLFPGMHIRLKLNMGQFNEDTIALAKSYADYYEARPDFPNHYIILSNVYFSWAFLVMFMCTYTDCYDFDIYFKKAGECFSKNPINTVGAYNLVPISAWASLVGVARAGAQEEYIGALSRSIPFASALGKGFFTGFDDLARGELCFYRGEFDEAEQYLKQSVTKAYRCDQFVTYNRALTYLMQLAIFRGDFTSAAAKLQEIEALLSEKDYGVRYTMYDIACGLYLLTLGRHEEIPEWLKGGFSSYKHPSFMENYANRVKTIYHYRTQQYKALLAFIGTEMEQTVLLGKIGLKVMQALSLYHLKKHREAITALTEAYYLAEPNKLIVLFTQFSKDMRILTAAALKDHSCTIPRVWLEEINRKSATYAKHLAHVISEYKKVNHITETIVFSPRETEILTDVSQGYSHSDIAAKRKLSVKKVKMIIAGIYDKAGAENLSDLVRIAVERKMV